MAYLAVFPVRCWSFFFSDCALVRFFVCVCLVARSYCTTIAAPVYQTSRMYREKSDIGVSKYQRVCPPAFVPLLGFAWARTFNKVFQQPRESPQKTSPTTMPPYQTG